MAKLDGNVGPNQWAGAFGEGFASMMHGDVFGTIWSFKYTDGAGDAERVEFQGNFKEAGAVKGNWVAGLPLDLYVVTGDQGSGGWSWRILWDFFDSNPFELQGVFARYDNGGGFNSPNPPSMDYGTTFDVVGASWKFKDVIVHYLGGNHMPANPARPPLDNRGEVGLDMTEFLDGMLCRDREEWVDMEFLVNTVMDFQAYNPNLAPPTCP